MLETIAPRTRLLDHKAATYYLSKTIPNKHKVSRRDYNIIARLIWKKTAESLVNTVGGVLLDKFGYLCHWMSPSKKIFKMKVGHDVKVMSNFHSNMMWYNTTLFTNMFKINYLHGWSMDKTFNRNIQRARFHKLKEGIRYKCFYTLLRTMYSGRFIPK